MRNLLMGHWLPRRTEKSSTKPLREEKQESPFKKKIMALPEVVEELSRINNLIWAHEQELMKDGISEKREKELSSKIEHEKENRRILLKSPLSYFKYLLIALNGTTNENALLLERKAKLAIKKIREVTGDDILEKLSAMEEQTSPARNEPGLNRPLETPKDIEALPETPTPALTSPAPEATPIPKIPEDEVAVGATEEEKTLVELNMQISEADKNIQRIDEELKEVKKQLEEVLENEKKEALKRNLLEKTTKEISGFLKNFFDLKNKGPGENVQEFIDHLYQIKYAIDSCFIHCIESDILKGNEAERQALAEQRAEYWKTLKKEIEEVARKARTDTAERAETPEGEDGQPGLSEEQIKENVQDIERRRLEELDNPEVTVEEYIAANPRFTEYGQIRAREKWGADDDFGNIEARKQAVLAFRYFRGLVSNKEMGDKKWWFEEEAILWKPVFDRINAKYDTELAALEKK